jgi:hypothetical protein
MLLPAVVIAVLLSARGLQWAIRRDRRAAWAGAIVLLVVLAAMQAHDPQNARARLETFEWDGKVIGRTLRTAFSAQQPLVAVDTAGSVPYFSGLPALDMLGLNDRYLPRHPPSTFGRGYIGHELGDGRYVLSRRPDIVVPCTMGGDRGCFRSSRELLDLPQFLDEYVPITLEGREPYVVRSRIWVLQESPRIGVSRSARVVVPGFLFASDPPGLAVLDGDGRLVLELARDARAKLHRLRLDPGYWRVTAQFSGAPLLVRVEYGIGHVEDLGNVRLRHEGGSVAVILQAREAVIRVRDLTFMRE